MVVDSGRHHSLPNKINQKEGSSCGTREKFLVAEPKDRVKTPTGPFVIPETALIDFWGNLVGKKDKKPEDEGGQQEGPQWDTFSEVGLELSNTIFTKPVFYCDPQHKTSPDVAEFAADIEAELNMLLADAVSFLENWKCTLAMSRVVFVEVSIISQNLPIVRSLSVLKTERGTEVRVDVYIELIG